MDDPVSHGGGDGVKRDTRTHENNRAGDTKKGRSSVAVNTGDQQTCCASPGASPIFLMSMISSSPIHLSSNYEEFNEKWPLVLTIPTTRP